MESGLGERRERMDRGKKQNFVEEGKLEGSVNRRMTSREERWE